MYCDISSLGDSMQKEKGKRKGQDNSLIYKIVVPLLIVIVILLLVVIIIMFKDNRKYQSIPNASNNGFSNNSINENVKLTRSDALNIVLKELNVNERDLYDLDIELENKYGKVLYEIDFKYNMYEYEYYIDASSGEVIHSFKEFDL